MSSEGTDTKSRGRVESNEKHKESDEDRERNYSKRNKIDTQSYANTQSKTVLSEDTCTTHKSRKRDRSEEKLKDWEKNLEEDGSIGNLFDASKKSIPSKTIPSKTVPSESTGNKHKFRRRNESKENRKDRDPNLERDGSIGNRIDKSSKTNSPSKTMPSEGADNKHKSGGRQWSKEKLKDQDEDIERNDSKLTEINTSSYAITPKKLPSEDTCTKNNSRGRDWSKEKRKSIYKNRERDGSNKNGSDFPSNTIVPSKSMPLKDTSAKHNSRIREESKHAPKKTNDNKERGNYTQKVYFANVLELCISPSKPSIKQKSSWREKSKEEHSRDKGKYRDYSKENLFEGKRGSKRKSIGQGCSIASVSSKSGSNISIGASQNKLDSDSDAIPKRQMNRSSKYKRIICPDSE